MTNFFKHLIERHSQPSGNIKPRLPGIFESDQILSKNYSEENRFIPPVEENYSQVELPVKKNREKFENEIKEKSFQKNTISNYNNTGNELNVKKPSDSILPKKVDGQNAEIVQNNPGKKTIPEVKSEKGNEMSPKVVNPVKNNQKTSLNILHIKPEIKNESGEILNERGINTNVKNEITGISEKRITSAKQKEIVEKEVNISNIGLKLPNRFNQWMNEPVKRPQSKEKEISASPSIKVNIGRIEVKAIMNQGNQPVPGKPAFKPKLSLEDYLNQRNGGKR